MNVKLSIYRYNPNISNDYFMQDFSIDVNKDHDMMLLDVLIKLKELDSSLTFRRSCREGVCGSDGINVNGKNVLACITPLSSLLKKNKKIVIRPLPGLPIIRDLVVDMSVFYSQYEKIKPFLYNDARHAPTREYLQSPDERAKLDGAYECILCACCSTACPSFWWNPDKFIGPAGLLSAYRFLVDSRDMNRQNRLDQLSDSFSVLRCHNIMNCTYSCPKGLNPTKAIGNIKIMLVNHNT